MDDQEDLRRVSLATLSVLALLIGLATGLGAILVGWLLAFFHNFFFNGEISFYYDDNELVPLSRFGPLIIFAPVIGGLGVVFLVRNFAPEARGNGVPQVLEAIYHRGGRVRPIVAVVKALAASLSIGSGASVGREGPMVQIGAAVGSAFGIYGRLVSWQRITLLAAGAGAGIAATFNTPLGAVLFAIELMLPEVSTRTFLPVVLATGAATYVGRLAFGLQPVFLVQLNELPQSGGVDPYDLGGFLLLGVIGGLVSWAFIRIVFWLDEVWPRLFPNDYVAAALGMGVVGLSFWLMSVAFGHYYVAGVGYDVIQHILRGDITEFHVLAIIFVAKIFLTGLSLGAGASGGAFSPALFVGAALGGAYGAAMTSFLPGQHMGVAEYAMIGMAVVGGGTTGAALTAITMVFELTRDYNIIVPLIMSVPLAIGVRRTLLQDNIYTYKLARSGRPVPTNRHTNMYLVRNAREIMETRVIRLPSETPVHDAVHWLSEGTPPRFVILERDGRIDGVVTFDSRVRTPELIEDPKVLRDMVIRDYVIVRENSIMSDVIRRLGRQQARLALVVEDKPGIPRADDVIGVIGKPHIADAMIKDQMEE